MKNISGISALANLRRAVGFADKIWVFLFALVASSILIAMAYSYYSWPRERSVFVSAHTETAIVKFTKRKVWRLGMTVVCSPSPKKLRTRQSANTKNTSEFICSHDEIKSDGPLNIRWEKGVKIHLERATNGGMLISVKQPDDASGGVAQASFFGGEEFVLTPNTRLMVPASGVTILGAKVFDGEVQLGQAVVEGTNGILLSGKYEIREFLPFRYTPTVVKTGELASGDTVRFLDEDGAVETSEGFVSAPAQDARGFYITTTATSKRNVTLRLIRHGFSPTSVVPLWTDRALADSWAIALTVILGVLVAFITLFVELSGFWRGSDK